MTLSPFPQWKNLHSSNSKVWEPKINKSVTQLQQNFNLLIKHMAYTSSTLKLHCPVWTYLLTPVGISETCSASSDCLQTCSWSAFDVISSPHLRSWLNDL